MTVQDYLVSAARRLPDKEALVCGSRRMSYGEVRRCVGGLKGNLVAGGLARGDRVAVVLENGPEAVISIFGTLEAGGCHVVINPATPVERLTIILKNSGARVVITTPDRLHLIEQASEGTGLTLRRIVVDPPAEAEGTGDFWRICRETPEGPAVPTTDVDLAAIIYTSGSTGRPKGVTMLHRNIDAGVRAIAEYLGNAEDDVILSVLPLSSSYGLLQLFVTFWTGGRLVLERGFGYPYEVVRKIRDERVTGFAGAPTVFALLLKLKDVAPDDVASMRYITNAAAALPAPFVPRLRAMFPATRIFLMHGLTECLRTTYLPPEEVETRTTSVGRGMPNIDLWVGDAEARPLPPGEVGEMFVRGPTVMEGYWNDPESTAAALLPGRYPWERILRTRDLFTMDNDGYFYFVARNDELIKAKGEKVSPIEVEDVIYRLEGVLENRVIGTPDAVLGQAIRAEIVLQEGASVTVDDVMLHCRRHLEDFKVPQQVVFVAQLPRTQAGKIRRSSGGD